MEGGKVSEQKSDEKLAASTVAGKGGTQGIISAAVVIGALGLLRGFGVQLWDENQDIEMAGAIIVVVGAIGTIVGAAKNIWKNWSLAKNGVTMTRKQ
jgi:hypothetical protein